MLERYNSFIIQHIDSKTKFEEKILSTSFLFLHSLVKMLKFTSIVGYTSCGPTYIESFLTIFGQCINAYSRVNKSPLPASEAVPDEILVEKTSTSCTVSLA